MPENLLISVICCAHNEETYVDKSIPPLLKALQGIPAEVIFIADRCTDNTAEVAKRYRVKVIEKTWKKWENSYSEALQTGYHEAKGTYVSILDPDILVPSHFFHTLLPLVKGKIASVAADVVTYPDIFWNRVMYAWEKTYNLAPLGKEPYGAARLILKSVLDEIGGFQDVPAPDTNLDLRLDKAGYKSVPVPALKTFHLRQLTLGKMISGQIISGRARYILGLSFKRTVGHSILRARPLILQGWMLEWMNRKTAEKPTTSN
jgi:glycosyltransferase involved in cell wall biosynthesis